MRLTTLSAPTCRVWAPALVLGLAASLAAAQGIPATATPPLHSSGTAVSGRVSEPTSEIAKPVPAPTPGAAPGAPTASTGAPATAIASETPPAPQAATEIATVSAPTSPVLEAPVPTVLARALVLLEPLVNHPVAWAGALLALMGILALAVYRRNRRTDALGPTWAPSPDEEQPAQPVLTDPLLMPRGLQAEIMALDLELGPSHAPLTSSVTPLQPVPAPPSGADLSLSKLQWAQQLLAAGENELARVLLTSVAESLQSQLQQRGDSTSGSHQ